jgi:hypothetical protein
VHKKDFGQAYYKEESKEIYFSFSMFYSIFYGFLKFIQFFGNLNQKMNLEKIT